jgi:hypothetical protein
VHLLGQVAIGYGPTGFNSLTYNGQQYLLNGSILQVDSLTFSDGTAGSVSSPTVTYSAATSTTLVTYSWGSVSANYSTSNSSFTIRLHITNASSKIIQQINLEPFWLQFPAAVQEFNGSTPLLAQNIGAPTAIRTTAGAVSAVVLVNDDPTIPLMVGYPQCFNYPTATQFPLKTWTGTDPTLPTNLLYVNRPIAAGGTDTYTLSLVFGAASATTNQLAGFINVAFAAAFPLKIQWPDRRGIGQLVLATSGTNYPTNPRGWFNDPTIDVTTPTGVAAFQARLLSYADTAVGILQGMNAQGAVVWDIEGEQYTQPNPVYYGDPPQAVVLAPEIAPVVNQFFAKFTAAGFRTGLCLRPQTLVIPSGAAPYQTNVTNPTQNLMSKISYAVNTWGASLFYVDSNVTQGASGGGGTMNPYFFQNVYSAFPNVLVMAEHSYPEYNAIGAPYLELTAGYTGTPASVLAIYASAFSVIYVPNGNITANQAALQASVDRGDILMFRGWWNDPVNAQVSAIYDNSTYSYKARPAVGARQKSAGRSPSQ